MGRHSQIATTINTDRINESSDAERDHVNSTTPVRATVQRSLRLAATVLFLLGLMLIGVGVASLFHTTPDYHQEAVLLVDAPVKSFGDAPSGRRVAVTFTLINRSSRAIRVLGATTPFCGRHGCLAYNGLPLDIPPLSRRDLVVLAETREPGQFASELTLFSDAPGQPQALLTVNGRVLEKGEKL
jgi:hypothetical protein